MSKTKMSLAILLFVAGCSDPQPRENDPAPAKSDTPRKVSTTSTKAAQEDDPGQPVAITIRKGDKRNPEAAYIGNPKKGNVSFDFANADLATIVLPLFSKQAGVTIEYGGPPRKLEKLRLLDEPWRDALCLICKFTLTHCKQSQVQGRIELVNGYDDPGVFLAKWDPSKKGDEGLGVLSHEDQPLQGSVGQGGQAGRGGDLAPSGAAGPAPTVEDPADFKGGNIDRIKEVRDNVNLNNSGVK